MAPQQTTEVTLKSSTSAENKWSGPNHFAAPILAVSVLFSPPQPISSANLLRGGLIQNPSASRPLHLPGEIQSTKGNGQEQAAQRRELVRSIRGKYAHVPTSSEAFASRKQQEIERESTHT